MNHVQWTFNVQLRGKGGLEWVLNPNLVFLAAPETTEQEVRRQIIHKAMQDGLSVTHLGLVSVRKVQDEPPNHPNCRCDLE